MSYQVGELNNIKEDDPWFYLKRDAFKHIFEKIPTLATYGIWDEDGKLLTIVHDREVFNCE